MGICYPSGRKGVCSAGRSKGEHFVGARAGRIHPSGADPERARCRLQGVPAALALRARLGVCPLGSHRGKLRKLHADRRGRVHRRRHAYRARYPRPVLACRDHPQNAVLQTTSQSAHEREHGARSGYARRLDRHGSARYPEQRRQARFLRRMHAVRIACNLLLAATRPRFDNHRHRGVRVRRAVRKRDHHLRMRASSPRRRLRCRRTARHRAIPLHRSLAYAQQASARSPRYRGARLFRLCEIAGIEQAVPRGYRNRHRASVHRHRIAARIPRCSPPSPASPTCF